jgi:hypothetical protein
VSDVNFDDIIVEIDDYEPDKSSLTLTKVEDSIKRPEFSGDPYDIDETLSLVDDPSKLFDFSDSKLNAVQQLYIVAYATKGTKKGACELAEVSYSTVKKWLKNEAFAEALENAVDIARDSLEEELFRRAMNGSDKLLLEALKALKPDKYQKRSSSNVNVSGEVVHTWADLAKEAAKKLPEGELIDEVDYEEVEEDEYRED